MKRGVYQGDTMRPLLFILITPCIINELKTSESINRQCRGKHEVLAFMDDFKCHAPSEKGLREMTRILRAAAGELGLSLNLNKCGSYNREDHQRREVERRERGDLAEGQEEPEPEAEGALFLPRIREGYKYLGIYPLERDTELNHQLVAQRVSQQAQTILESKLAPAQKVALFNSALVPAAVYVLGNLYPNESRATTLKKCRDLDREIRKILVDKGLKGRTTARVETYIPQTHGGLGLNSLEMEVEVMYVRRGLYAQPC